MKTGRPSGFDYTFLPAFGGQATACSSAMSGISSGTLHSIIVEAPAMHTRLYPRTAFSVNSIYCFGR